MKKQAVSATKNEMILEPGKVYFRLLRRGKRRRKSIWLTISVGINGSVWMTVQKIKLGPPKFTPIKSVAILFSCDAGPNETLAVKKILRDGMLNYHMGGHPLRLMKNRTVKMGREDVFSFLANHSIKSERGISDKETY